MEHQSHNIFCELAFLKSLVKEIEEADKIDLINPRPNSKSYLFKTFNYIFNSNLYMTRDDYDIYIKETNSYIELIRDNGRGADTSIENPVDYPPNTIFLGKSDKKTKKYKENYGLLYFNKPSDFINHIKEPRIYSLGSKHNFKYLGNLCCSSIIITDQYLFDTKIDRQKDVYFEEFLLPFLKEIMPKRLSIPFQITIIAPQNKGLENIQQIKLLKKKLGQLGFHYEIKLTILSMGYHDRHIFTNYHKITLGKGFKDFSSQNYLKIESNLSYEKIDREITFKLRKLKDYNKNERIGDNFENRLFSLIQEIPKDGENNNRDFRF